MWLISLSAVLSSCGMEPVPSAEPSSMTVASDSVTNAAVEETTAESTEPTKESASTDKNEEKEKTEAASTTTTSQKKTDKKIPLSFYETELKVGETQMPIVDDEIKEIWTSSDNDVASVDEFGNITAKAEGKCTITVASAEDNDYRAEINVTVVPQPGLTYIDGILIANKTYSLPSDRVLPMTDLIFTCHQGSDLTVFSSRYTISTAMTTDRLRLILFPHVRDTQSIRQVWL